MTSPYIDTELYSRVSIQPYQLDSDIYLHLKDNLIKLESRKCNKYGYIVKIYKILDFQKVLNHTMGEMSAENFVGSVIYNVKYSCRLCRPVKNTPIVCQIAQLNKALIKALNGPIIIIITTSQYNSSNFGVDANGNLRYLSPTGKKEKLKQGDIIKINIEAVKYNARDIEIRVMGKLDNVASKEEIKEFERDLKHNEREDKFIDPSKVNQDIQENELGETKEELEDEATEDNMVAEETEEVPRKEDDVDTIDIAEEVAEDAEEEAKDLKKKRYYKKEIVDRYYKDSGDKKDKELRKKESGQDIE